MQEEGIAALMLACPGACHITLNLLFILSFFFFPCVVFDKTYLENEPSSPPRMMVGVGGGERNPQIIFHLPIWRCHGSKNLDSEDKNSRV